jgi:hypothetical protein
MPTFRHSSSATVRVLLDQVRRSGGIVRPRVTGDSEPHCSYAVTAAATALVDVLDAGLGDVLPGVCRWPGFSTSKLRTLGRLPALTCDQQASVTVGHRCSFPGGYIRSKPRNRSQSVTAASNVRCSIRA